MKKQKIITRDGVTMLETSYCPFRQPMMGVTNIGKNTPIERRCGDWCPLFSYSVNSTFTEKESINKNGSIIITTELTVKLSCGNGIKFNAERDDIMNISRKDTN